MEMEVVKNEKDDVEIMVDNGTVAEVLRVYLNKDSAVKKAVWKRDHPSKPVLVKIQTSGKSVKKAVSDSVVAVGKDLDILKKIK